MKHLYDSLRGCAKEEVANGSITNNPVFDCPGTEMNNRNATQDDIWYALAKYVPAVSSPVGGTRVWATTGRDIDDLSYLVIRTRTKVDANGNLVSAHYGKIYGLWEFFGSMRASRIQFNSKPNDPNLEDVDAARYSRMLIRQTEEQIQQERLR